MHIAVDTLALAVEKAYSSICSVELHVSPLNTQRARMLFIKTQEFGAEYGYLKQLDISS